MPKDSKHSSEKYFRGFKMEVDLTKSILPYMECVEIWGEIDKAFENSDMSFTQESKGSETEPAVFAVFDRFGKQIGTARVEPLIWEIPNAETQKEGSD